jgi:hypothetical protein
MVAILAILLTVLLANSEASEKCEDDGISGGLQYECARFKAIRGSSKAAGGSGSYCDKAPGILRACQHGCNACPGEPNYDRWLVSKSLGDKSKPKAAGKLPLPLPQKRGKINQLSRTECNTKPIWDWVPGHDKDLLRKGLSPSNEYLEAKTPKLLIIIGQVSSLLWRVKDSSRGGGQRALYFCATCF